MELKPGYKRTDLGVIPEDWDVKEFEKIGQVIDGDRGVNYPSKEEFSSSGHCLFLSAKNVTKEGFEFSEFEFITQEKDSLLNKGKLVKSDVVLTTRGTVGNVAFFDDSVPYEHIRINSGMVILRNKGVNLETTYLYRVLQSRLVQDQIDKIVFGSAQPQLTVGGIEKFQIPIPPTIEEQRAIAAILDDVDALITALDRLIAKKRAIKQGAMQQLLTGKTRLPGFGKIPAKYKQTEIGATPEDWEVGQLGGCLMDTPDYGINAPAVPYSDRLPVYIRITDITDDGRFSAENIVSVEGAETQRHFLNVGDLVLARTGASVGKSYLYNPDDGKLVFAGFLIRVRPNPTKLDPRFLAAYLTTGSYWSWVKVMSMRSGQPGINSTEYAQLPIPIPPLPEQHAIAAILSDMDAEIAALERKRDKTRILKQGMMQTLLTGEIRLV
jgi:type I restriction enzyme S subunit